MINEEIERLAKTLSHEHQVAYQNYSKVAEQTNLVISHKDHSQASLMNDLAQLRATITTKVNLINQVYDHYNH